MPLLILTQRTAQRLVSAPRKEPEQTQPEGEVVPLFPFSQRISHRYPERFTAQGLA